MGREIGQKCVRNMFLFLVLAFFSVVASSPNLSTFIFRLQKYEKSSAEQNKSFFFSAEMEYLRNAISLLNDFF
jgi:hypothetical protein